MRCLWMRTMCRWITSVYPMYYLAAVAGAAAAARRRPPARTYRSSDPYGQRRPSLERRQPLHHLIRCMGEIRVYCPRTDITGAPRRRRCPVALFAAFPREEAVICMAAIYTGTAPPINRVYNRSLRRPRAGRGALVRLAVRRYPTPYARVNTSRLIRMEIGCMAASGIRRSGRRG